LCEKDTTVEIEDVLVKVNYARPFWAGKCHIVYILYGKSKNILVRALIS
jgi:hypothetical protein